MPFSVPLVAPCAACSQGSTKMQDLNAFVDAQPWLVVSDFSQETLWMLVLAEYKRLFPDGPACTWKDLRAHYELCAPRPILQRLRLARSLGRLVHVE